MQARNILFLCAFAFSAQSATAAQPMGTVQTIDPNDRRIACFREMHVPATYEVTKHLQTPAQQYYVKKRNGIIELRERPAVYREEKRLVSPAHTVMQEVQCPS